MPSLSTRRRPLDPPQRGRTRFVRPLDVLPDASTAAAMDDAEEAERLVDDLVALVEAGLVIPVDDHGLTRYAPADPDFVAA